MTLAIRERNQQRLASDRARHASGIADDHSWESVAVVVRPGEDVPSHYVDPRPYHATACYCDDECDGRHRTYVGTEYTVAGRSRCRECGALRVASLT